MKRKRKGFFVQSLLTFQLILILLICAALIYVHFLLTTYEKHQPERLVREVVATLTAHAENGTLWETYALPEASDWEADTAPDQKFAQLITADDVKYAKKAGISDGNEIIYTIKTADGFSLGEVTLKAVGEPVTRLAIFTWQEWEVSNVAVTLTPTTYTMTLPSGFTATVNGMPLTEANGIRNENGEMVYTVKDLLFLPKTYIQNENGEQVQVTVKGNKIIPMIFNYDLTLPYTLSLTLDGQPWEGMVTSNGYRQYSLMRLTKPEVTITDCYGNTVNYEGESSLPLTHLTVTATNRHTVTVNGQPVPKEAVFYRDNSTYEPLRSYVSDLPQIATYAVAILVDDADIAITAPDGTTILWDKTTHLLDLVDIPTAASVPETIAAEVDVLYIAKQWSLFVSNDLSGADNGLSEIAAFLIPSSYQYEIAVAYAKGTDINFTSVHTLKDPPFTEEQVTNFVKIAENCFSVDVSFKKHMILYYGEEVIDTMNERLYFVKYDNPDDPNDTAAWKLASMKEIVNAE